MNREESSFPSLIGAIILGKEVVSIIKKDLKRHHSLKLEPDELRAIIRDNVLQTDIIEFLREHKNRRKGTDRRQRNIPVEHDRRSGGDRRVDDTRTELQKRLQELDVSLDVQTTDPSRGFV